MRKKTCKGLLAAVLCCLLLLPLAPAAFAQILYGDVNFDNTVTAEDARLILRAAVGLEDFTDAQTGYGDIDLSGDITAADARLALRLAVGLSTDEDPADDPEPADDPAPANDPEPALEARREAWLRSFPDAVSYDDLESNMNWLVNEIGQRNFYNGTQNAIGDAIYERLGVYGYTGAERQIRDFYANGVLGRNVLGIIPTAVQNPKILLVLSHYDTVRGTGGAVDNSSGASALLQLAKRFKATGEDYGLEVRFLFTAGEEQGYFGAYAYVNSLSYEERSRHILAFNMDMAGKPNDLYEPGRSYYLTVSTEPVSTDGYYAPAAVSNIGSQAIDSSKAALGYLGESGYYSPVRAGMHDIVPFRKAGMTALTLSWRCIASAYDRHHGSDYGFATPYYTHTPDDNMYYFDTTSLYNTTRLVAGAIARLILPYNVSLL